MKICAVAHALPSRLVTNADLLDRVRARNRDAVPADRLDDACTFLGRQLERAGAQTRYHRADHERSLDVGVAAGQRALERARLAPDAIDLLIYVGVGRGFVEPATANVFQDALGLSNATCFDLLDACASWLRGVDVARHMLRSGLYRHAMVLNCECNFQEYEPTIESAAALEWLWAGYTVGEAATATILSGGDDPEYHVTFQNLGHQASMCQIPLPQASQYLTGDGMHHQIPLRFYASSNALAASALKALDKQFHADPILPTLTYDVIFGHSASVPTSRSVLRRLGLDEARHYDLFPRYGNTVSAGLPLAMSLAEADGRLHRGDRVLFIMGGAGLTTALCTLVY